MRPLELTTRVLILLYFVSTSSGCFMPSGKCRPYVNDLTRLSTRERIVKFHTYNWENQYQLYLCGMQEIEPPVDLAVEFAKGGKNVVELLKVKLSHSQNEETISDLIRVIAEIKRIQSYDVEEDRELIALVTNNYFKMKDEYWKRVTEKHMKYVLKSKT